MEKQGNSFEEKNYEVPGSEFTSCPDTQPLTKTKRQMKKIITRVKDCIAVLV